MFKFNCIDTIERVQLFWAKSFKWPNFGRPLVCPASFCPALKNIFSKSIWPPRAGQIRANKVMWIGAFSIHQYIFHIISMVPIRDFFNTHRASSIFGQLSVQRSSVLCNNMTANKPGILYAWKKSEFYIFSQQIGHNNPNSIIFSLNFKYKNMRHANLFWT